MRKVAIVITNYNMPERTDALCKHIAASVRWPYDLIVVDNGSDLVAPSKHTNLWLPENKQTTGGWLAGLRYATEYEKYFAYWFLITSAEFIDKIDPLTPLAELLADDPNAVGVHPALTADSTTSWKHLITQNNGAGPRRTWFIDNIASLYRASWFDGIGRFDPRLKYAWGIDLMTCHTARMQERGLYVHEGSRVKKVTDIGYQMNRMNMTAEDRGRLAHDNMAEVLSEIYGPNWWDRMTNEGVQGDWR